MVFERIAARASWFLFVFVGLIGGRPMMPSCWGQPTSVVSATATDSVSSPVRNVLLIMADDLKASVLGCYGDPHCQTPNLDRLAAKGLLFEHAYCQATWCAPSRRSMMFGRYRDQANVTLGQQLQDHAAYTARVGKIFHMRVPGDIIAGTDGLDQPKCWTERFNSPGPEAHTPGLYACLNQNLFTRQLANRQSTKMPHRMFVTVQSDGDGTRQADYKAASQAIELLKQRRQSDQPFFLAVGLVRPHYPMVAPSHYFDDYPVDRIAMPANWKDDTSDIPRQGRAATTNARNSIGDFPENQKRMWSGYYASVAFMDAQVGRILDALEQHQLADSTAVIFTSDHGYHLGEHGWWQKSNLHEEVIRVPLIVRVPQQARGRSKSMVELIDLYPTVCQLMSVPTPAVAEGKSLLPVLQDPLKRLRQGALSIHNGHSLRTDHWHYMRYTDGSEELYDMQQDPGETRNLAGEPTPSKELLQMRQALQQRLREIKTAN